MKECTMSWTYNWYERYKGYMPNFGVKPLGKLSLGKPRRGGRWILGA